MQRQDQHGAEIAERHRGGQLHRRAERLAQGRRLGEGNDVPAGLGDGRDIRHRRRRGGLVILLGGIGLRRGLGGLRGGAGLRLGAGGLLGLLLARGRRRAGGLGVDRGLPVDAAIGAQADQHDLALLRLGRVAIAHRIIGARRQLHPATGGAVFDDRGRLLLLRPGRYLLLQRRALGGKEAGHVGRGPFIGAAGLGKDVLLEHHPGRLDVENRDGPRDPLAALGAAGGDLVPLRPAHLDAILRIRPDGILVRRRLALNILRGGGDAAEMHPLRQLAILLDQLDHAAIEPAEKVELPGAPVGDAQRGGGLRQAAALGLQIHHHAPFVQRVERHAHRVGDGGGDQLRLGGEARRVLAPHLRPAQQARRLHPVAAVNAEVPRAVGDHDDRLLLPGGLERLRHARDRRLVVAAADLVGGEIDGVEGDLHGGPQSNSHHGRACASAGAVGCGERWVSIASVRPAASSQLRCAVSK